MNTRYDLTLKEKLFLLQCRISIKTFTECLKQCRDAGIPMNFDYLVAHHDCGGDIVDLLNGLLLSKRMELRITSDQVAYYQLEAKRVLNQSVVHVLTDFIDAGIWDFSDNRPPITTEIN